MPGKGYYYCIGRQRCHFITTHNVLKLSQFILHEKPFDQSVLTAAFFRMRQALKIAVAHLIKTLHKNEGVITSELYFQLNKICGCARQAVAALPSKERQALKQKFSSHGELKIQQATRIS
jgi:hypothetical protein